MTWIRDYPLPRETSLFINHAREQQLDITYGFDEVTQHAWACADNCISLWNTGVCEDKGIFDVHFEDNTILTADMVSIFYRGTSNNFRHVQLLAATDSGLRLWPTLQPRFHFDQALHLGDSRLRFIKPCLFPLNYKEKNNVEIKSFIGHTEKGDTMIIPTPTKLFSKKFDAKTMKFGAIPKPYSAVEAGGGLINRLSSYIPTSYFSSYLPETSSDTMSMVVKYVEKMNTVLIVLLSEDSTHVLSLDSKLNIEKNNLYPNPMEKCDNKQVLNICIKSDGCLSFLVENEIGTFGQYPSNGKSKMFNSFEDSVDNQIADIASVIVDLGIISFDGVVPGFCDVVCFGKIEKEGKKGLLFFDKVNCSMILYNENENDYSSPGQTLNESMFAQQLNTTQLGVETPTHNINRTIITNHNHNHHNHHHHHHHHHNHHNHNNVNNVSYNNNNMVDNELSVNVTMDLDTSIMFGSQSNSGYTKERSLLLRHKLAFFIEKSEKDMRSKLSNKDRNIEEYMSVFYPIYHTGELNHVAYDLRECVFKSMDKSKDGLSYGVPQLLEELQNNENEDIKDRLAAYKLTDTLSYFDPNCSQRPPYGVFELLHNLQKSEIVSVLKTSEMISNSMLSLFTYQNKQIREYFASEQEQQVKNHIIGYFSDFYSMLTSLLDCEIVRLEQIISQGQLEYQTFLFNELMEISCYRLDINMAELQNGSQNDVRSAVLGRLLAICDKLELTSKPIWLKAAQFRHFETIIEGMIGSNRKRNSDNANYIDLKAIKKLSQYIQDPKLTSQHDKIDDDFVLKLFDWLYKNGHYGVMLEIARDTELNEKVKRKIGMDNMPNYQPLAERLTVYFQSFPKDGGREKIAWGHFLERGDYKQTFQILNFLQNQEVDYNKRKDLVNLAKLVFAAMDQNDQNEDDFAQLHSTFNMLHLISLCNNEENPFSNYSESLEGLVWKSNILEYCRQTVKENYRSGKGEINEEKMNNIVVIILLLLDAIKYEINALGMKKEMTPEILKIWEVVIECDREVFENIDFTKATNDPEDILNATVFMNMAFSKWNHQQYKLSDVEMVRCFRNLGFDNNVAITASSLFTETMLSK